MAKKKKLNPPNTSGNKLEASTSLENSSNQTNLELDNRALRAKNSTLVQTVAKLQHEKAQQQLQISQLQEDNFRINSTYLSLRNILLTIDSSSRQMLTKYVDLSNMFTTMIQLCAVGKSVNLNRISDSRTQQAVLPHTVNGHVLQNPTISLSRLTSNATPPKRRSNQNQEVSGPRTDAGTSGQCTETNENISNEGNSFYGEQSGYDNVERVNCRRRNVPVESLNMDDLQQEEDDENNGDDEDDGEDEEMPTSNDDYCSRLFTIREDDENDFPPERSRIVSREVKIFIDRLPSDYVRQHLPCILNSSDNDTATNNSVLYSSPNRSKSRSETNLDNRTRRSLNSLRKSGSYCSPTLVEPTRSRPDSTLSGNNSTVIRREETLYRTMSSMKRREARYFGEPSTILRPDTDLEMTNNISAINDVPPCTVSHIEDSTELQECLTCSNVECPKKILLDNLGLEPFDPKMTTSTPLVFKKSRNSSSNFNLSTPMKNTTLSSNVNNKRGSSNGPEKIAKVILNRMVFDKRSSSSSANKGKPIVKAPVVTKSRQIKKIPKKPLSSNSVLSRSKSTNSSNSSSPNSTNNSSTNSSGTNTSGNIDDPSYRAPKGKENVDTSNLNDRTVIRVENDTEIRSSSELRSSLIVQKRKRAMRIRSVSSSSSDSSSDEIEAKENAKRPKAKQPSVVVKKAKVKASPNDTTPVSPRKKAKMKKSKIMKTISPQKFKSPRPKRAARPTLLTEPSLNKKMRRSK